MKYSIGTDSTYNRPYVKLYVILSQRWCCKLRRENMSLKKEESSIKRACVGQMMRKCGWEGPVIKTMLLGPRQTDVSIM